MEQRRKKEKFKSCIRKTILLFCQLKGSFTQKSLTYSHIVPDLSDFLSSVECKRRFFFVHTMFWEHWNMLFFVVFSEPKVYFMQTQTVFVMIDSCRTAHLTLFTTHPGELYSLLQTVHHLHWGCFSLICIVTNIWLHHTQSLCWNKSDHSKKNGSI